MEHRWNETDRGKPTTRRKTCPSATLSTTNPTWTDPGSNPCLRGGRPVNNYRVTNSQPLILVLCQMNPTNVLLSSRINVSVSALSTSLRSILTLFSYVHLGIFPYRFYDRNLICVLISIMRTICLVHLTLLNLIDMKYRVL